MPTSPTPADRPADQLRAALVVALDNANHTHPCQATGSTYWTGCYHPDGSGPSCHSERRADAVLAVLPAPALAVARQLLGTTVAEGAAAVPTVAATLATPCDACDHTLNWHRNDVGCTVPRCVCGQFQDPVEPPAAPPAPADRAAVLREVAAQYEQLLADIGADTAKDPRYWTGVQHVTLGLRRLADGAAAGVQPPTTSEADTVLAAAIPEWEAVYEPGNVSDYLIGYANTEAAAKGAAIAWVLSQSDKGADRLEWEPQTWSNEHDEWFDLFERHDDGTETGVGVTVRHRVLPYTAADFTPEDDEQPAAPAVPEEPQP